MPIQKLRLRRGWSQEQLAEIAGLSARTIQRIERGQPASLETLKALGAAFDLDFSTLRESNMTATGTTNELSHANEALAMAQVRRIKGFYIHVAQYVVVIPFLVGVNFWILPRHFWVIWPALG